MAITGPAKAAMKYITRNYARDEHVWLWSDFWSAFKTNWKQGLAMSVLTGVFMFLFFYGLIFYNNMAGATGSTMYLFLQVLLVGMGAIFMMMNLYAWPMMVTYDLKLSQIYRNSLVLALGRPRETVRLVDVPENGDTRYYRDGEGVHYVPKRRLEELIL